MQLKRSSVNIVGMAIRAKGISSVSDFLRCLEYGVSNIFDNNDAEVEDLSDGRYQVKLSTGIEGYEDYNPNIFGFSLDESPLVDPQIREMLKVSIKAIEDAGINILESRVGVIASMGESKYLQDNILNVKGAKSTIESFKIAFNTEKDYAALRISSALNLKGPSMTIQSTCSSGLSGVAIATDMLAMNRCDYVLVVSGFIDPSTKNSYIKVDGDMLSMRGDVSSFDSRADGTVFADAACAVILSNSSGSGVDVPYASITGSAINNDGRKQVFTAPNKNAISDNLMHLFSGVEISDLGDLYVEMHGTGTILGDSIEWQATLPTIIEDLGFKERLYIGAVKSLVGHTSISSGLVGLIKCALSADKQVLFGMPHLKGVSKYCRYQSKNIVLLNEAKEIQRKISYVMSALGMGGTNAHVLVQKANPFIYVSNNTNHYCLMITSIDEVNLSSYLKELIPFVLKNLDRLDEICYELAMHRFHYSKRIVLVSDSKEGLVEHLTSAISQSEISSQFEVSPEELIIGNYNVNDLKEWVKLNNSKPFRLSKRPRDMRVMEMPYPSFSEGRFWISSSRNDAVEVNSSAHRSNQEIWNTLVESCEKSIGVNSANLSLSYLENGGDSLSALSFSSACQDLKIGVPSMVDLLSDQSLNNVFHDLLKGKNMVNEVEKTSIIQKIPTEHFAMAHETLETKSTRFVERYLIRFPYGLKDEVDSSINKLKIHLFNKWPVLNSAIKLDKFKDPVLLIRSGLEDEIIDDHAVELFDLSIVGDSAVFFSIHHLICDFSSASLIASEIQRFFDVRNNLDERYEMETLSIDTAKPIEYQFPRLKITSEKESSEFWLERFRNKQALLKSDLSYEPTDTSPRFYVFEIKGDFFQGLEDYLKQNKGVSRPGLFLSIASLVLSGIDEAREMIFGIPFNFRDNSSKGDVGSFINTLPIVVPLVGGSLKEHLVKCSEELYTCFGHSTITLSQILNDISFSQNRGVMHFNQMFSFQDLTESENDTSIGGSFYGLPPSISRVGLLFRVEHFQSHYRLEIECDPSYQNGFTAQRFIAFFSTVLKYVLSQEDLDDHFLSRVIKNTGVCNYGFFKQPQELLASQFHLKLREAMEINSDEQLISNGEHSFTYRSIKESALQLAHRISNLGCTVETPVLLIGEFDEILLSSFLGVLINGSVPVLLGVEDVNKIEGVIQEIEPALIIATSPLIDLSYSVPVLKNYKLFFNEANSLIYKVPKVFESNAAYISYTSGTTGSKKPVCVNYSGLFSMISQQIGSFGLRNGMKVLKVFPLNADASISEIFTAIFSGSTLVAPRSNIMLGEIIEDNIAGQIEMLTTTPDLIPIFMESKFHNLRIIVSAGDRAKNNEFSLISKEQEIINAYGPAEATVCTHIAKLSPNAASNQIGQSLDHVQTELWNDFEPSVQKGNLKISGIALSRGYVNQPKRTFLSFYPSLDNLDPSHLSYVTNDVVTYHKGSYFFEGRVSEYVNCLGDYINLEKINSETQSLFPFLSVESGPQDYSGMVPTLTLTSSQELDSLRQNIISEVRLIIEGLDPILAKVARIELNFRSDSPLRADSLIKPRNHENLKELVTRIWGVTLPSSKGLMTESFFALGGESIGLFKFTSLLKEFGYDISLREAAKAKTLGGIIDFLSSK